jgi:RNA 2',3'-cyclic 3'-phosphodiesterase
MTKRLFIAIKVNPDNGFLEEYRELRSLLRHEAIKWVEERNIHVTLKFLGETEEERIPAIITSIEQVAVLTSSFEFFLRGLGVFGSSYNPKVVWTGIDPYDRLAALMKQVHKALEPAGFPMDRQNLVPHLTLGRVKFLRDKVLFQKALDNFKQISSEPMTTDRIILFESILKKEGPEYQVLQAISFQK